MNSSEIRRIAATRFSEWEPILVYWHATPIVCVGVGHGQESGQLHVLVPENVSHPEVVRILERTLQILRKVVVSEGDASRLPY